MDELKEECGVAAVSIDEKSREQGRVVHFLYRILLNLQHRGQLSAGITTYNGKRDQLIDTYKNLGTVNEVFKTSFPILASKIFSRYAADKGIGHVRYATCGKDSRALAQPFERHHGRRWEWFSFGFNGNVANYVELKKALLEKTQYHLVYNVDTEIFMHYIARELGGKNQTSPDLRDVFNNISKKIDGSYCMTFLNANGELVALRDPMGIKPLCFGKMDGVLLVASESNALSNSGVDDIKTLEPGKMLHISDGRHSIRRFAPCKKKAYCMFEWVYFANVASNLEGKSVYKSRINLGKELAKIEPLNIDDRTIIVAVPDSAKSAGNGMAYELGLPSEEGLVRNRFVGRTFIEGRERHDKVRNKFTALKEILRGKKIILVDDSIVRGTTTKRIIRYIKEVGKAKEVHVRVSCPPIMAPCFYGIDMSSVQELFAPRFHSLSRSIEPPEDALDKMAKALGADSLVYQTIPGLIKAIGLPKEELCMACLNGKYPTPWGCKLYRKVLKGEQVQRCRAYEA